MWDPGWRWSEVVKPVVDTPTCLNRHLGYVMRGHLHVVMDDGTELDIVAGDAYEIPPGHDAWVVGDEVFDAVEFASARGFGIAPDEEDERTLATILFTDIVDSTATLARLGDRAWRRVLLDHNDVLRSELDRFRGREIITTGDGFLALFDGAARAVRCAAAMTDAVRPLGIEIRAGLHTGEVTVAGGNARGVAVHAAARVAGLAGPGEVLVSGTTRDLLDGSGMRFEDRGLHELKGLEGVRQVCALVRA
jgi:class 3 adenylate cyclase